MIGHTNESTISLPSDSTIQITRSFDAPRATVFDAWTKPERLAKWWDPSGRALAQCEIDLRPDGKFRFEHLNAAGGAGHVFAGVYREVTPPSRLVFATPSPSGGEVVGVLEFGEEAGRTSLRMTMNCASKADRDALLRMQVDVGTVRSLENLDGYLATTR